MIGGEVRAFRRETCRGGYNRDGETRLARDHRGFYLSQIKSGDSWTLSDVLERLRYPYRCVKYFISKWTFALFVFALPLQSRLCLAARRVFDGTEWPNTINRLRNVRAHPAPPSPFSLRLTIVWLALSRPTPLYFHRWPRAAACNLQLCFGRARVSKTWHEFAGESNFVSGGGAHFENYAM